MAKKASAYVVELCEKHFARFTGNEIDGITFHKHCWYWRLVARNGKTLAHSENYNTRRARDNTTMRLAMALGAEVRKGKV